MKDYSTYIDSKSHSGSMGGFSPVWIPNFLFDFQESLTDWAIRKGRGAIFADCGLGKTAMELVWAENVVRRSNGRALILCPLAVAAQMIREGEKFGIEVRRSNDGKVGRPGIYVTNYEKLHLFDGGDFVGVVCDESSCIKNFNGFRRAQVTDFMRKMPYRLLATATAAPNDYTELGTSSEALGELGHMDMLARFFKNDRNTCDTGRHWRGHAAPRDYVLPQWRFKGHAELPFWRWVCSWARAVRKPSDLGFADDRFILPPLIEREHVVESRTLAPGMLFAVPASNMQEEREELRRTITERCEKAASLVDGTGEQAMIWCQLNDEGDMLAEMIPGSVQISGKTPDEAKEEAYEAFAAGQIKDLITKAKIGAWGLNFQNCGHVVSFATHSFEQYYQQLRRCWRFGQTRRVLVDLIATEGQVGIKENMQRKSRAADRMFIELVAHMNDAMRLSRMENAEGLVEVPAWL